MKRVGLGVLVLGLIVVIFSTEGILALLRQRNLTATVELRDAQGIVATQAATSDATAEVTPSASTSGKPQAISSLGTLPADGSLVVNARWSYSIGPRFPQTTVRAQVTDTVGVIVATDTYVIDCGGNTLDCSGDHPLTLVYGVKEGEGSRANWPAGSYTLRVTRAYAGLKESEVLTQSFVVTG